MDLIPLIIFPYLYNLRKEKQLLYMILTLPGQILQQSLGKKP